MLKWGIVFLLYILIGALLPFTMKKDISSKRNDFTNPDLNDKTNIGCDRAKIIDNNDEALEQRLRLIQNAKDYIILCTYDFETDESGKKIIAVLSKAAKNGVKVNILIDGFCALRIKKNKYFYYLSQCKNVDIRIYNCINILKPWKIMGRMHDKYTIADDCLAIMGGRNISNAFLSNQKNKKSDRDILVFCPDHSSHSFIFELKAYFKKIFNSKYCSKFKSSARLKAKLMENKICEELHLICKNITMDNKYNYSANTYETDKISLISNSIDIYSKPPSVFYELLKLMQNAKRIKIHTPYVIFNSKMYKAIKELCKKSKISIMLNSVETGANLFASSDYYYSRKKVVAIGADILEYDKTPYHGKSIVIDDSLSAIGSFNFDIRSTYINTEIMAIIKSKEINRELSVNMERYENHSVFAVDKSRIHIPFYKRILLWFIHQMRLLRAVL